MSRYSDVCLFSSTMVRVVLLVFFFNDTATTEIYTLSLHDALPISRAVLPLRRVRRGGAAQLAVPPQPAAVRPAADRKSTRLNSSHSQISYAVFCLKKKNYLQPTLKDRIVSL